MAVAGGVEVLQVQHDADNDGAHAGRGDEAGAAGEDEIAVAPEGLRGPGGTRPGYEIPVS